MSDDIEIDSFKTSSVFKDDKYLAVEIHGDLIVLVTYPKNKKGTDGCIFSQLTRKQAKRLIVALKEARAELDD